MNEQNITIPEVVEPSAIELIQRAEVDVQISTAKKYPRQLGLVKQAIMSFATLDEETAAGCFYSVPRAGKAIQGPSVRLAEIAVSCYRNLRAGSRVISTVTDGPNPHVIIQAVAHDLENNVAITVEKRRAISTKKNQDGTRRQVSDDDITLASNAGAAIAFRDAVFKVVPMALIKPALEAAKQVAIGDAKTLGSRRIAAVDAFSKMGVKKDRVLAAVGKFSIDEIGLGELEVLIGLYTAIKDGNTSIDDAFPDAPVSKPEIPKPSEAPARRGRKPASAPVVETTAADSSPAVEVTVDAASIEQEPNDQAEAEDPAAQAFVKILEQELANGKVDFVSFRKWVIDCGRNDDMNLSAQNWNDWNDIQPAFAKTIASDKRTLGKIIMIHGKD